MSTLESDMASVAISESKGGEKGGKKKAAPEKPLEVNDVADVVHAYIHDTFICDLSFSVEYDCYWWSSGNIVYEEYGFDSQTSTLIFIHG